MAIPAPNLQNLTGLVFLMTAEVGIIISGFDYEASGTMDFVYDSSVGYDVGFVEYNYQLSGSVKGKLSGSGTGSVSAAVPGTALSLGNSTSLNGITAGTVFATTISGSHGEKAFRETTTNWIKKPGIVAS